jgi:hypothetical protein
MHLARGPNGPPMSSAREPEGPQLKKLLATLLVALEIDQYFATNELRDFKPFAARKVIILCSTTLFGLFQYRWIIKVQHAPDMMKLSCAGTIRVCRTLCAVLFKSHAHICAP